jgi:ankyrin repeat protein
MTPLMKATAAGHIEVVEILINAGAKVDLRDMVRRRDMDIVLSLGIHVQGIK